MKGPSNERFVNTAVALAAVVIAAVAARREFFPARRATTRNAPAAMTLIDNWRAVADLGHRSGQSNAPVTIVEFADFECPFCKRFHDDALAPVLKRMADSIAFIFVHFPIPGHRFARPAAQAAECAADQSRFREFAEAVYAKQDSLGLKSWVSYAADADVANLRSFQQCLRRQPPTAIDSSVAQGLRIGVKGTPTILVNGWLAQLPPTDSALTATIATVLRK